MADMAVHTEGAPAETSAEVFQRLFPTGRIKPTSLTDLPQPAIEKFEGYSKRFIPPNDYKPGNFDAVFRITHDSGNTTYVTKQTKSYKERGQMVSEESTYLCDIDTSGNRIGWGEIRKSLTREDDYFKDKPFVGYTFTEEDFRGQGLGKRRLFLMNALTQMLYRLPLNSDTAIIPNGPAAKIWEGLVTEEKARKYMEGPNPRYAFVE